MCNEELGSKIFPSHGLTCQMIVESLVAVQAQLGEELSQTKGFSTLQTNGTTKFEKHYATYDVRVCKANTYSLGLEWHLTVMALYSVHNRIQTLG